MQIISKLVVAKLPRTIVLLMRNFIANFVRILGICKDFAGNRVNELGNVPRCEVVPKFSDLEVVALGIAAEAFGFDSENLLFHRLHHECKDDLPNLISRRQFNARRKLTARLAEEIRKDVRREYHDCMMLADKGYLSAGVQKNLFEVANITLEVPYRLNQKNWRPPVWAYRRFRKRIETIFSQLNDNLMMIRNYAKQSCGLFTRMAGKIAAMTFMQYVNFINHRPIGQIKYSLI